MCSIRPYIGCKIGLISKAQNRYEGILYTVDKVNSTIVLEKVKCFGTEGRPTDRPTPPKDDIYEYITFRGSDIRDIPLCEPPRPHHGLPLDPAIVQSSSAGASGPYSARGPYSPLRMPPYNQLAALSLLSQQYPAGLGFGPMVPSMPPRRGPMVEKAVQTLHVDRLRQRDLNLSQEREQQQQRRWEMRRPQRSRVEIPPTRRSTGAMMKAGPSMSYAQKENRQQSYENRPPPRRRQGPRRRKTRSQGQLMVANVPSAVLKFDTDFDFVSSNAQFNKEELEKEVQDRTNMKDGNHEIEEKDKEEMHLNSEEDHFGPKCYYDKAKSFFDNISSERNFSFRLTWAEERKRNLETFGVPGRFRRPQGFRGGYAGRRGRGQAVSSYRTRSGRL